jgi:hypothetical protein
MVCDTCGGEISPQFSECETCRTPVGSPPLWPGVRTYPVHGIGRAAAVAVGVTGLGYVLMSLSPLLGRAAAGRAARAGDPNQILFAGVAQGALALGYLAAYLTAGVLVIIWCYRARKNLDAFPGTGTTVSGGWAIAGWLVPIANFFVPCRVVANIARDSLWRPRTPALVGVWWAAWLVFQVADRYVSRRDSRTGGGLPDPHTPDDFQRYDDYFADAFTANLLPTAACVVAAAALIVLVHRISAAQTRRIARGGQPAVPVLPGMTMPFGAVAGPGPVPPVTPGMTMPSPVLPDMTGPSDPVPGPGPVAL